MCNNATILGAIPINPANHHAIRPRISPTVSATLLDWEFQVRAGAGEGEAFVVVVCVWVGVVADGLAIVVIGESGCGGIVDVVLGVFRSWGTG
jgi:hypothetical protein